VLQPVRLSRRRVGAGQHPDELVGIDLALQVVPLFLLLR
jgi:hypothetical protein